MALPNTVVANAKKTRIVVKGIIYVVTHTKIVITIVV